MNQNMRLTVFWMSFVVLGILLALFLGIGWLFLLLTLRRAIVFIPSFENAFRQRVLGLPPRQPIPDPRIRRTTQLLGIVTLLVWTALTIIAFVQLNFPLIQLLNGG